MDALAALLSLASAYIVSVLIWLFEEGLQHMLLTKLTIGGIELNDIKNIMQTGVYGIAVSGLIANSANAKETVKQILDSIHSSIYTTC